MVVYVEFAFLFNFLLDGTLLYLALKASKSPVGAKRLVFSAAFGGGFALLFPFLALPEFFKNVLKFAVGFLLCFLAFGRVKTKKEWGRYAFTCVCFFLFTFAFAGALSGVFGESVAPLLVLCAFALLAAISVFLIGRFYQKRAVEKYVYDCAILLDKRRVAVSGFYDSGNFAAKGKTPVCFVSPDIVFEVWGEAILEGRGQVCDEIAITTLGGEKKQPLYKADLEIVTEKGKTVLKEVYFSPSANMLSREYKLLLPSRIFEENGGK